MSDPSASTILSTAPFAAWLRLHWRPLARHAARWLTWIYVGGLAGLLGWLEWHGERTWFTGLLLFAPPQVLLLPLLLLSPLCLAFRARLLLLHLVVVVLVAFGFMSFRWNARSAPGAGEIRVVTHNAGQNNKAQFYDFLATENPDIIVLQDARGRSAELARKYPDRRVLARGEFCLLSRFPILHSDSVEQAKWLGRPVAARFELLCREKPLIVYSVHLPTPRRQLNRFLSGRALADLFADEDTAHPPLAYGEWTRARLKLADDLAAVLARETLPFIVCGDFNTPDHGIIYHTIARGLADAHLRAGRGWGLSFPGATRNPLTLHGPWLRLDYAFAGRGWEPVYCEPEPGRRSQHCAVAARFIPKPG